MSPIMEPSIETLPIVQDQPREHSIQLAISLGGDADTLACITGGLAQAYYKKIPDYMIQTARDILDPSFLSVVDEFTSRFHVEY